MFPKILFCIISILLLLPLVAVAIDEFVLNGFNGSNLALEGSASVTGNGLLILANESYPQGHAFYPPPFRMRNLTDGSVSSFSANFVFAIRTAPQSTFEGDGIAFVLAPTTNFTSNFPSNSGTFGLLSEDRNGNTSNHVLAIELDTWYNQEFEDIDNNHVGIDVNSVNSSQSSPAGYYHDDPFSDLRPLRLTTGEATQVWIEYDHLSRQLNVTMAPVPMAKPKHPLLSPTIDLSTVLLQDMYVGFSSSSGYSGGNNNQFILGCSFKLNGIAESLDYSKLPSLNTTNYGIHPRTFKITPGTILVISTFLGAIFVCGMIWQVAVMCVQYGELREDWEVEFGPHRFSYQDLLHATEGFKGKQLLGVGGFGKVYKGVLPTSKLEVAVKVMSHDSKQGMREFIAEIVSMGRLRHRNLVQLLGYCRRKGELLLVYENMPNGSLDKYLYDSDKPTLDWSHRFEVIKGVASGLLYLHEEWEQVVIHRDVKASNVLLDSEMNGRLGDFGLARLHDHGVEAHTTHVAGTRGYISPELARLGKATKATDVFAFGAFILEVACGRRPIGVDSRGEPQVLVDLVLSCWQHGTITNMVDQRLGPGGFVMEEAELVLKLGLLCSHPSPASRPTMRLVMQYLSWDVPLPDIPVSYMSVQSIAEMQDEGCLDEDTALHQSVQTSITSLSGGR